MLPFSLGSSEPGALVPLKALTAIRQEIGSASEPSAPPSPARNTARTGTDALKSPSTNEAKSVVRHTPDLARAIPDALSFATLPNQANDT